GIRFAPLGLLDIRSTIGARMYAIRLANTNGSSTARPRNAINRTNSVKPQRPRNLRAGAPSPNQVSRRDRACPCVGPDSIGRGTPSGGSVGVMRVGIPEDLRAATPHVREPAADPAQE